MDFLNKKYRIINMILFIAALGVMSGCGNDSAGGAQQDFADFVETTRQIYQVPGAAVGIVVNDRVVFLKGFGVGSMDTGLPVDENTRFQIASNSKLMTAAAIGVLVDQGVVDWDAPLIQYDPTFQMPTPKRPVWRISGTCWLTGRGSGIMKAGCWAAWGILTLKCSTGSVSWRCPVFETRVGIPMLDFSWPVK